jgi:hypothetical protein
MSGAGRTSVVLEGRVNGARRLLLGQNGGSCVFISTQGVHNIMDGLQEPGRGTKDADGEPHSSESEIRSGSWPDLLKRDMTGCYGLCCGTLGVNVKGVGRWLCDAELAAVGGDGSGC